MSSGRSGSCLQYAISTLRHTVSDITVLLSDTLLRWALLFLARGLRHDLDRCALTVSRDSTVQ
jgi:hypothetical protein